MTPLSVKNELHEAPKNSILFQKTYEILGEKLALPDTRATRSLIALMCQGAVNGGAASHWGGPSAMVEMMTALHEIMFKNTDWFRRFNFVNDIGHAENGIYALRANYGFKGLDLDTLKGFRSINSYLTGHGESHLYPEGVLLSNGPLASALPQAEGLAAADKFSGNKRVTICSLSDGASMEGEAKEAFASIPGLFKKGKLNPFIMIISDNNTKLSGRIDEDSFAMDGTFNSLSLLGWNVIDVKEGNDLEACFKALDEALVQSEKSAVCIRLRTIKGIGYKKTQDSKSGGHGYPLKAYSEDLRPLLEELWEGDNVPPVLLAWADSLSIKPEAKNETSEVKEKVQEGLSRALIKMAKDGLPVVSVSSDLQGSTGILKFHKEFPDRFIDVGISESNMVSMAVGLSKAGYIPVVDTFAAFGVTKGNLPLIMSSLSEAPLVAFFSHIGFQDAADGASHQSLTYLSALASIPHLKLVVLSSSGEAEFLVREAILDIKQKREKGVTPDSYVFFLGRESYPVHLVNQNSYQFKRAQVIKEGKDLTIVSQGALLYEAIKASSKLKEIGVEAEVICNPYINEIDFDTISQSVLRTKKLLTVEDHQLIGGMGSLLTHALKLQGLEFKLKSLGVLGSFGRSAYKAAELYEKFGLSSEHIVSAAKSLKDE